MLPKKQRLIRKNIDEIMKGGQRIDSPFFTIRYISNTESFRISPVVSKKIAKNAITRNLLRRKIYNLLKDINIEKPIHVLVFLKKEAASLEKDIFKAEIIKIFNKLPL